MQIKSFKAPTLKEAMANVKAELGADAVILHTSKTKKGGILGFHSKEIVEVIAAVEDAPARNSNPPVDTSAASDAVLQAAEAAIAGRGGNQGQSQAEMPGRTAAEPQAGQQAAPAGGYRPRSMVNQYQTAGTLEAISQAMAQNAHSETFGEVLASVNRIQEQAEREQRLAEQQAALAAEEAKAGPAIENGTVAGNAAGQAAPAQNYAGGAAIEPDTQAEAGSRQYGERETAMADTEEANAPTEDNNAAAASEEVQDLQNQLEEMKRLLVEMSRSRDDENVVPTLQSAMQTQGVSQHIVEDMISKLTGTEILAPQSSVKAAKALEKYVRKAIRIANGITLYSDKPKIVALIGPTGVGKTTTLAKIAARFVLEQGTRVALITADTYRISAVEQLKTYSDILGLPLEIVYNPQALREAIAKHQDKQLILLDTAGRSQYNSYQMKELSELLNIDADIEKHLVMSATTKTSDGLELLANFAICKPDRVIFTKVDETKTHGIIFNILHRRKVALSYLTNGQSVPDDIEPASVDKVAELLLR